MTGSTTASGAGTVGPAPSAGDCPAGGRPKEGPAISALARCVRVSRDEFARSYWSSRALLSSAAETGADFTDLLSEAAVDELLSRRGLRTPFLRMAKQGKVIAPSAYTRSGGSGATIGDQVADDKVLRLVSEGATLVLQALHRTWPPLVDFGSALASEVGHPVQINAYITPAENQGFSAHYDTHDVFVLQVAGRKRWVISEPVLIDPLPTQTWEQRAEAVAARAAEPPLLDVTLEPGDALYLPRGFLHSATALGELSIHLTVGVHPVTRYSLAQHLLTEAATAPDLRRSLPMGVDLSDPAVLAEQLSATARALNGYAADADGALLRAVADRVESDLNRTTRPRPIAPLAQLAALHTLSPQTELVLRPGLRASVTGGTGNTITLRFLDQVLQLPATDEAAVKAVLAGQPVTAAALPGLDGTAGLELARRLLTEAVLVPVAG